MASRKTRPRPQSGPTTTTATYSHSRIKHHGKRNVLLVLVSVLILGTIVFAVLSLPHAELVAVGQQAPNFSLTDVNGASFTLSQLRGRPALIEFMSTSCIHCQNEAPTLAQLYNAYSGRVAFVSVSITPGHDTPSVLQDFAQRHSSPWTWVRDTDVGDTALKYGVSGTPTIYIIDKTGVVAAVYVGEKDGNTLSSTLSSLL